MFGRRRLACSFCGRGEADVDKLVAGPRVYICDRCVAAATRIMESTDGAPPAPQPRRAGARAWLGPIERAWRRRSGTKAMLRSAAG